MMVRMGPINQNKSVSQNNARVMIRSGKPVIGFIFFAFPGLKSKKQLDKWLGLGSACVSNLPRKSKKEN